MINSDDHDDWYWDVYFGPKFIVALIMWEREGMRSARTEVLRLGINRHKLPQNFPHIFRRKILLLRFSNFSINFTSVFFSFLWFSLNQAREIITSPIFSSHLIFLGLNKALMSWFVVQNFYTRKCWQSYNEARLRGSAGPPFYLIPNSCIMDRHVYNF